MICALHEVAIVVGGIGGTSRDAVVIVEGYSLCRPCAELVVTERVKTGRAMRGIINQVVGGRYTPV